MHTESISRAFQRIVPNPRQRQDALNSTIMLASTAEQGRWAAKWLRGQTFSLSERLIALVVAKAIFFHSSFAVIEWFQQRGNLPGLSTLISLIARDMVLHAEFACTVVDDYNDHVDAVFIHNMLDEAIKIEHGFMRGGFNISPIYIQRIEH